MDNELSRVIKSRIAIRAIEHVIDRARQFNEDYFPVKIKSIAIGGSSLRVAKPKDIDLFVEARATDDVWYEFEEFKRLLNNNFQLFVNVMYKIQEEKGKATTNDLIDAIRDDLTKLGFKDVWIEKWLPWLRITDIRDGIREGIPRIPFEINDLIKRYLKSGWHGRRLEIIQVTITDPKGRKHDFPVDVPFLTIWTVDKGLIIPTEEDVQNFFRKEYNQLVELAKRLEKLDRSTPHIYHSTLSLFIDNREKRFRNTKQALKRLAISEITNIKKITNNQDGLPETITEIRQRLKRFALVGLVYYKIINIKRYKLMEVFTSEDPRRSLSEILHKTLKYRGYRKEDIENFFEYFDIKSIYNDLREEMHKTLSRY